MCGGILWSLVNLLNWNGPVISLKYNECYISWKITPNWVRVEKINSLLLQYKIPRNWWHLLRLICTGITYELVTVFRYLSATLFDIVSVSTWGPAIWIAVRLFFIISSNWYLSTEWNSNLGQAAFLLLVFAILTS